MKFRIFLGAALAFFSAELASAKEPCPAAAVPALLKEYLDTAERGRSSTTQALLLMHRLEKGIFCGISSEGHEPYRKNLLWMDQQAKAANSERELRRKQALFELAKMLQFHWESRYGRPISHLLVQNEENGAKIGMSLGILALVGSVIRQPQNTPTYFRLLRHLFPVTGVQLGASAGQTIGSHQKNQIPPSPASLMKLGLRDQPSDTAGEEAMLADLTKLSGSIAAGSLAAELLRLAGALQWMNRAMTPLKFNLLVLAIGTAAGIAAESGIAHAAEVIETHELQDRARRALRELQLAHPLGNAARTHAAAERLVLAITDLQARLNRPALDALENGAALSDRAEFQHDPKFLQLQPEDDQRIAAALLRKGFSRNIQRMIRQAIAYLNCLELPYLSDQTEILNVLLQNQIELSRHENHS